jgi:Carboxypeptidase regulatory-like domain/TonB dependent receptor-like, beta-barrel
VKVRQGPPFELGYKLSLVRHSSNSAAIHAAEYRSHITQGLILLTLLISSCVVGQAQNDAGFILRGQVVDQAGSAVKAANVTLRDDKQNEVGVENTDQEGRFAFNNVSAGGYDIEVKATGFGSYRGEVKVETTKTDQLKIVLNVESLKGEVEVKGERNGLSTESSANANAIVLREKIIKRLPRDEEQLRRVLERIAGSFAGMLQISVNGISGSSLPPTATIKEIRINSDPFSAAYHEPGSARVEIETKSGDMKTRGSVFLGYRNSALDARNAFSLVKPPLEYRDVGGYVSSQLFGPRSFIFGLIERRQHDEATPITAFLPDGRLNFNVPTPSKKTLINLRADFLPSDRQTISLFFNHDKGWQRGPEITSLDLPERSSDKRLAEEVLQASWRVIISPRLINEAQLRVARERMTSTTDNLTAAIEVAGAFNGGGPQCCPERHAGERLSFADNLTFSLGRHLFKTGVSVAGAHISELSQRDFGGTYYYASLSLFRLGRPQLFTINVGEPRLGFGLWNFAAYFQDELRLKPGFSLSPGLRYETQTDLVDHNNFAPRLGFAWMPFKSQNTVIRGGAGIFYQQLEEGQLSQALRHDGIRQRQVIVNRPRLPDPFGGRPITSFPISVNRLATDLRTPYQFYSAIGLERRLPSDVILTATYNYIRGVRLFRSRDINAPMSGSFLRPRPELLRVTQLESSSISTYHGLTIGISGSVGERVSLFGNYTLSRAIDDADGPGAFPVDSYNLVAERGFSARDERHQLFIGAFLVLPFRLEASPFVYFNTGRPYNITTGFDDNGDSVMNDRPLGVLRNSRRGPNFASVDLRLSRSFGFGRRGTDQLPFTIEVAGETTNLFNRVNFADFNGVQTSPFFGQANAANNPRQITLQMIFYFN